MDNMVHKTVNWCAMSDKTYNCELMLFSVIVALEKRNLLYMENISDESRGFEVKPCCSI